MRRKVQNVRLPIDRNQPMKVTFGLICRDRRLA
jgi:hypothetical protein